MPDKLFFPLATAAAALMIVVAMGWPAPSAF
jgi:hypothetical protein